MLKRMKFRICFKFLLPILLVLGVQFPSTQMLAYEVTQEQVGSEVNRVLAELARAERVSDWNTLYDLMLPDARMLISRTAFNNWWPTVAPAPPASALRVESVDFGRLEYDLTNTDLADVATTTYSYKDSDGIALQRTVKLGAVGEEWRWLPDIPWSQVAGIQGYAGYTVDFESSMPDAFSSDLDMYWAQIFADWDADYHPPVAIVAVTEPGTRAGCRIINDLDTLFAEYCTRNQTIYYNPEMRDLIESRFGEMGWDMVMAHEWGHHIQNISGYKVTKSPELFGGDYSIEHELQADCLSATYLQDATARGLYRSRDLNKLETMISYFGDELDSPWSDISAHGTADQRQQSFFTGFDDGLRGCEMPGS